MPCLRCLNVSALGERGIADHDASGYLVDIACVDRSRFDPQTTEQIYEKCDILAQLSARLNKSQFTQAQQWLGLTYNAHGVLWDEELRNIAPPIEVGKVDPAHTFLCDGMCQKEITALFTTLIRSGIDPWEPLRELAAANWQTCKCLGGRNLNCNASFNASREIL